MATASYEGEAIMKSCWVSVGNNRIRTTSSFTTKCAELYPMFLALGFCLFRNIFFRSTLRDDFFKSLRIFHGILADDHTVFRCYLLFVSNYRRLLTSHNHFRMAREKRKLYLAEMFWKKWSAHHENSEEFFFLQRKSILPFESANYSQ